MGEKIKVLVIDDSPFIFKAVRRALDKNAFEVVDNAQNGKIGLEMAENYKPDIITLDVTMPVMDGIETAKELLKRNPKERIIMLSAMGDEDLISQARDIGIKEFLNKPFKAGELLESITKLLEGGV